MAPPQRSILTTTTTESPRDRREGVVSKVEIGRLVVRWERIAACFEAFLAIATIHIWIHRLIGGYIHWNLSVTMLSCL